MASVVDCRSVDDDGRTMVNFEKTGIKLDGLMVVQDNFTLGPIRTEFDAGKIHCLLGPNGAGKTTLIRTIMGTQKLRSGRIVIGGADCGRRNPEVLKRIGLVPDDAKQLIEELTAPEFWSFTARMYCGKERQQEAVGKAMELAERLEFTPPRETISAFSLGMRKKTQLVAALMHDPALLILDEPRNGLDPIGIHRMEGLLQEAAERGATVVAASHDLDWVERFADRVYILNRGVLEASGSVGKFTIGKESSLIETFLRIVGEKL